MLTSDPVILKVIRSGYLPSFSSVLPPFSAKNNTSASHNVDFLYKSLAELFLNDFAELVQVPPKVINPFSVSIRTNGKKRLIADLWHLNQFLAPPHFKIDDYKVAMPAIKASNFMFTFNLKKGYYHVELDDSVKDLFSFAFEFAGRTYYR